MKLSKVLVDQFAKVTNDVRQLPQNATLYGTIKVNDGKNYVQLDGSDLLTPCTSSVNVKNGERVMVVVGGHEAVITGNMSSPAAGLGDIEDAKTEINEEVDKSLDAYDTKLIQMNTLAANTLGFYYTEEKAADGSIISYRHDKAKLSDSTIIYKSGIDGFFLSVDGGQTWKAGFDRNGDAVLNILYAIGIQSKWINTRGFTATDNNGKETFRIDEQTGSVHIDPNTFMLGDKDIFEIINGEVPEPDTLTSADIWRLLLQSNKNFIYKGSDGNIYIKATYIDTGNLCGWKADRVNKKLTATCNNAGYDEDGIDLSAGGEIVLDASKALIKSITPYTVFGGYGYAALFGNSVLADNAKIRNFLNNASFSKGVTINSQLQIPNIGSGSGTSVVVSSSGYIKKSSSSKRYKKHISFMDKNNVQKLYDLRPVYFNYKEGILEEDDEDCSREIPGFYAELVEKYFPEAVVHNKKGQVEDWDVRKLVPAMLKLIQLQKEQLDRQEERLSKIESILNLKEK